MPHEYLVLAEKRHQCTMTTLNAAQTKAITSAPHRAIEAVRACQNATNIVFLVGAGASTSAGIPDFRSSDGLYARWGTDLFHETTQQDDPQRIYDFYREFASKQYRPTVVQRTIARLTNQGRLCSVLTQNIDGLEEAAGIPTDRIEYLHGSLAHFRCERSGCDATMTGAECQRYMRDRPLRCYQCASSGIDACGRPVLMRPDIVLFGEPLDPVVLHNAKCALFQCDLFVCVGTSLRVDPVASLPRECIHPHARRIWINRDPPPAEYIDFFDACVQAECDAAIDALFPPSPLSPHLEEKEDEDVCSCSPPHPPHLPRC